MDRKKRILLLCDGSDFDVVESSFQDCEEYDITMESTEKILDYGVRDYLERTIHLIKENPDLYDGIVGTHDSSAVFASVICDKTGKRFAPVRSIINCQNKYLCRTIQRKYVPEAAPAFCLALDYLKNPEKLTPPFFIKPVRANISFCTHEISSPSELEYYIGHETESIARQNHYYLEALSLSEDYRDPVNEETCNSFLCEDLIPGEQATIDGFVFEGDVECFGITRAVFHEDSHSFSHHEFPCTLSRGLQEKIRDVLSRLIPRLGINNSFFNVEFRVNQKDENFSIIEVNSRIAFQFAKTIQAVTGYDPLRFLYDVATGTKPELKPVSSQGFKYCYNFELHSFSDKKILKTPTQTGYQELRMRYPEVYVRNLIHETNKLSDYKHNPESFRYCILDIPGNSEEEIMNKYGDVVSMLQYEFEELGNED